MESRQMERILGRIPKLFAIGLDGLAYGVSLDTTADCLGTLLTVHFERVFTPTMILASDGNLENRKPRGVDSRLPILASLVRIPRWT